VSPADDQTRLTFAQAEAALAALEPAPMLIAIDGLPLSGKSTLSLRLADLFGWSVLEFDDFYLPAEGWPSDTQPAFPFPFFRLDEFREAVRALRVHGRCSWRPIDWPSLTVQSEPRHASLGRPLIVEGCSVLDPELASLYDVRLFVDSDRDTLVQAQKARDGENVLAGDWAKLFLPSVDLYMRTQPQGRADLIVAGRGCRGAEPG
jgi:uridine kinase